jgi:hypothetical protein
VTLSSLPLVWVSPEPLRSDLPLEPWPVMLMRE